MPRPIELAKQLSRGVAATLTPWAQTIRGERLWVLMYHRVLPLDDPRAAAEEPGMIVTPASFRRQLELARQLFTFISLTEWVERMRAGQPLPRRACAITFDDGWRDNFEFALPILRQLQVPATVFAVAGMIGTRQQFWPNRLANLLSDSTLDRGHASLDWLRGVPEFGALRERDISREAMSRLINACKIFDDDSIAAHLDAMEQHHGGGSDDAPALMDWEQLHSMQSDGLIEIGSHTSHHCRLREGLAPAVLQREVVGSRSELERALQRPVKLFCYPNGDVSRAAAQLVGGNYLAAVTTRRGINRRSSPLHELARIGIHEDVSATDSRFRSRLSGWV